MEIEMRESNCLEGAREERNLRQRLRRLFCCFLRQLGGDEQGASTGGDVAPAQQAVRITVESLGMVNVGFSLLDEEPPTRRASPLRVCTPALRKKRAKPPRSLSRDVLLTGSSGEDGDEEEENEGQDGLLLTESASVSGLLPRPAFPLIPLTPSVVADESQLFDISPVEGEEAPADEASESERDPQKEEGKKLWFSCRCQQGASLAEHPRKSESVPPLPFLQSCISVLFVTQRLPTPSESY